MHAIHLNPRELERKTGRLWCRFEFIFFVASFTVTLVLCCLVQLLYVELAICPSDESFPTPALVIKKEGLELPQLNSNFIISQLISTPWQRWPYVWRSPRCRNISFLAPLPAPPAGSTAASP